VTPDEALDQHRRLIGEVGETVYVRRFTGSTPARTHVDTETTAYVRNYGSNELIGSITQGDQRAITLVDTLSSILPVTTNDKLVVGTKEFAIKNPMRRVVGGTLIALEIHAAG
jgi:hypothetical protein